ncbi:MAG: HAMP domain-containing histidine kinase [Ruminococcaceae bacterium]|nr:HAMP domain-containing histidine kinase [Oscillospiraceae bacterium]MBQ9913015.1 HAMP domain-containing histidine kinase [Clostridia bacterium]
MAKRKQLKRRKRAGILRKYFFRSAATVVAGFIALCFIMMFFIGSQWWDEKNVSLNRNINNICETYTALSIHKNSQKSDDEAQADEMTLHNVLNTMGKATLSEYFITDINGDVLYCSDCEAGNSHGCENHRNYNVAQEHINRALKGKFSDYIGDEDFEIGSFVVVAPIFDGEEPVAVAFGVEDAITGLVPYSVRIIESFFYSLIIALIAVFIALFVITRDVAVPLSDMQKITDYYAKGDFDHKARENYKNRELNDFAKALNKMGYELKINEDSRKSFVANVSHELKTPMTSIGGFIDGMMDGTIPAGQEKKYLGIVSNEVKRLSRMVVSMLNLSKIEAGEIELSPIIYDVTAQVFETLLSFEKTINEKHIDIEGFEEMGSVLMRADKDLVQQVIYNLLDNAVKFTPENGTISVFAENDGETTTVTVRNSGQGISEEEISRIFERFYKVDKSRSYDTKGVGLGLYIVKTIINMHDGEITASSKQGEYTEFSFEIPYIDE